MLINLFHNLIGNFLLFSFIFAHLPVQFLACEQFANRFYAVGYHEFLFTEFIEGSLIQLLKYTSLFKIGRPRHVNFISKRVYWLLLLRICSLFSIDLKVGSGFFHFHMCWRRSDDFVFIEIYLLLLASLN